MNKLHEHISIAGSFINGFTRVTLKNGKSLHLNVAGKPSYKSRYDIVGDFYEGRAWAILNGKYFHIDYAGRPIYKERYDTVDDYNEGFSVVSLNKLWFHIDLLGKPAYNHRFAFAQNFQKGIAVVRKIGDDDLSYTYIDYKGVCIVKPKS